MSTVVNLSEIISGMDDQFEESTAYLNKITGNVVVIQDEEFQAAEDDDPLDDFPEWQRGNIVIAKEIQATHDYIELPSKFDIHEYEIMERFCLAQEDDDIRDKLYRAIKGNGAFRYFKDQIHEFGITDDWYKYRDEAVKQIAIDWCEGNGIEYSDQ